MLKIKNEFMELFKLLLLTFYLIIQEFCCMEEIHIGQQIKIVFETKGISVTEFARRINKSRENMYSIFSRKTIDSGLLLAISRVLEFDFFKLYSKNNYVLQEEVQKLREENQILKDYTALLREQKGQ
jgi:hypothetical protein